MKEYKRFTDTEAWKWIRTVIEIALIVLAVIAVIMAGRELGISEGFAEDSYPGNEYEIAYAICKPGDTVNVRPFPNTKHERSGYLEPGDVVYMDGKKKNGFVHCVNAHTESGEGWVYKGYLVDDKPERMNRTATVVSRGKLKVRQYVDGKCIKKLKPLATVKVYYWTDEWALTNYGYVQSRYLELNGE